AIVVALTVAISGGFSFSLGSTLVRSHDPLVPSIVAALAIAATLSRGRPQVAAASRWWWKTIARLAKPLTLLMVASTMAVGWLAGTHVAGGSDSYCYLNQAEMFARGEVREAVPLSTHAPWRNAIWSFTPAGFTPSPTDGAAIVPICAAGYPLM